MISMEQNYITTNNNGPEPTHSTLWRNHHAYTITLSFCHYNLSTLLLSNTSGKQSVANCDCNMVGSRFELQRLHIMCFVFMNLNKVCNKVFIRLFLVLTKQAYDVRLWASFNSQLEIRRIISSCVYVCVCVFY